MAAAAALVSEQGKREGEPGITPFQGRVYALVASIPAGRVMTYGDVARALGCGSSRAVGQALRRNPFAPRVPCHRVIRTDLTIGGFLGAAYGEAVARKLTLLAQEGVSFVHGRLKERERLWRPEPVGPGPGERGPV